MRLLSCSLALTLLAACGANEPGAEGSAPAPSSLEPTPAPAPSSPGPSPATPVAQRPAEKPVNAPILVATDLSDPKAGAVCAERAKITPRGSVTTDRAHPFTKAVDVFAFERTDEVQVDGKTQYQRSVNLVFQMPTARSVDAVHGAGRSDVVQGIVARVLSSDANAKAFTVGTTEAVEVGGDVFGSSCFADGTWRLGAITADAPTSEGAGKLTIASRTAAMLEGTIELPQTDGTVTKLTFRAPLDAQAPALVPGICCLK